MIDKKDFLAIRKEMEGLDEKREKSIAVSREIIKLSKRVIYSVHRDNLAEAKKFMDSLNDVVGKLKLLKTFEEGHYRTAMQEYVEAACFYGFVASGNLPRKNDLGVSADHYILGVCDLSGELVRRAINSAAKGKNEDALAIKDFLEQLYGELLEFDFRNGDIRRKFDGIKYDLQKLEDMAFEISRRN